MPVSSNVRPHKQPPRPAQSTMNPNAFLESTIPYLEAFAEFDLSRRFDLLSRAMTPSAEIWGPKRVFTGYAEISEKIDGFHKNWPDCRLVFTAGPNTFLNVARFGCAIINSTRETFASGESIVELAEDGRYQRVIPFWEVLPALPAKWPEHLQPRHGIPKSAA